MKKNIISAILEIGIGFFAIFWIFLFLEPAILQGAQNTFTIAQTVSKEISFTTPGSNVTLSPSLGGLTGGTATGETQIVVTTNSSLGYMMTIMASSSVGMIGNASSSNSIPAYVTATAGVPDFSFTVPANKAYFGYSVEASTTADLATSFKDAASACDSAGGSDTADKCWIAATSTAYTVVNRTWQTPASGATTTLKFRVTINANPSPVIPDDTYVATTTLTATAN
ncbi:MAG: hypothetical protein WCS89_03355 [Candidatus Paceibacterota bacterium]|jgi:hypothetical protein